ncbi:MAG: hypothetical protein K0R14_1644 [Burkholderiales bacterium]|jgi:hypothetical protein|nr:hypothetical protein [Burkholderiales bacterium]
MKKIIYILGLISCAASPLVFAVDQLEYVTKENYPPKNFSFVFMACRSDNKVLEGPEKRRYVAKSGFGYQSSIDKDGTALGIARANFQNLILANKTLWNNCGAVNSGLDRSGIDKRKYAVITQNFSSSDWVCWNEGYLGPVRYDSDYTLNYVNNSNNYQYTYFDVVAKSLFAIDSTEELARKKLDSSKTDFLSSYVGDKCMNLNNRVQQEYDAYITKPAAEIISENAQFKLIKVTDITATGAPVSYRCEILVPGTNIYIKAEANECSLADTPMSSGTAVYFKAYRSLAEKNIRIKAERLSMSKLWQYVNKDSSMSQSRNNPYIVYSGDILLGKYMDLTPPVIPPLQIENTSTSNMPFISGNIKNTRSGNFNYSCVSTSGESPDGASIELNTANYEDTVCNINKISNGDWSFSVADKNLIEGKYLAIKETNVDTNEIRYSNSLLFKINIPTPDLKITFSDSKSTSGKVSNVDDAAVTYSCVDAASEEEIKGKLARVIPAEECGLFKINNKSMTFTAPFNLNGNYFAIKATKGNAVRFSNAVLLKDEIANRCTYANTNDSAFGTFCSPLPECKAPVAADFNRAYYISGNAPVAVVKFNKNTRTSNTFIELRDFDDTVKVGQTNPNVSLITDNVVNTPSNPGYFDYKAYNICEHGETSEKSEPKYCVIRVYKNGQAASVCDASLYQSTKTIH